MVAPCSSLIAAQRWFAVVLGLSLVVGSASASSSIPNDVSPGTSSYTLSSDNQGTCINGDTGGSCKGETDDKLEPVIAWVRSQGGFISSKINVRSDGIFAVEDIEPSDLLFSIPYETVFRNEEGSQVYNGLQCGTIRTIMAERKLGNGSSYSPYLKFLESRSSQGQLPSLWSDAGKDILLELLGGDGYQTLPPEDPTGWIDYEWTEGCNQGRESYDPMEHQLAMYTLQNGWSEYLIPILDLMNHRKGRWLNTEHNAFSPDEDEGVVVTSARYIQAGEQLYTDYGEKTVELFRDCGVVEPYPQSWEFHDQSVYFTVDYNYDDSEYSEDDLVLEWDQPLGNKKLQVSEFFRSELFRLNSFEAYRLKSPRPDLIPEHEWDLILEYNNALKVAITLMLAEVDVTACSLDTPDANKCTVSSKRYDPLVEPFDDGFLTTDTCDQQKELDHSHYTVLETIHSQYQEIQFLEDPVTKDMCFSLDSIYQICTKYRPHYHEPVVHYSARFVDAVRRVIFIGGGDSMLLHEVLKYDTLEFVVGLEIDQKVTRNSFKYFGTQPHWDNDKVQWWYGDAAKSLLMLPKSYFGTFDLVLVDLSETVMSNTVTKELDIMSALSLLLKPDGIFLKNEMYFRPLSRVFKHTIQIHYYDVPLVCSQCLVMGSNKVDFIQTPLKDHGIETMHQPVINLDHDFSLVHDYMKNTNSERHCAEDNDDREPAEQDRSPGVLMILEAEDASKLEPTDEVEREIVSSLVNEGLTVVKSSTRSNQEGAGSIIVLVLREGYIVVRTWPENNYCAFDIHLWSLFEKQEGVKKALLVAVGSTAKSSFRIAAGGMFGVSTWKDDDKNRGPKFTQDCSDSLSESENVVVTLDENTVSGIILKESLTGLHFSKEKTNVAVLCGSEKEKCNGFDILLQSDFVNVVVPLWICPSIIGKKAPSADQKFSCEKKVYAALKKEVKSGNGKIGAIVVDPSTSLEMAQIVHSIVRDGKSRMNFFTHEFLAVAPIWDEAQAWRSVFVDSLREFFDVEPGFKSDVFFKSSDTSIEVISFSSGDPLFVTHLKECTKSIEKRTGLVSDIRHIGGVEYSMQHNFKPTQFFNATDYDRREAYKQWSSQHPVGYQVLFQFEVPAAKVTHLTKAAIRALLEGALVHSDADSTLEVFTDLGDGSLLFVTWSAGNVVVLFNGRDHVDVNLFTHKEDFAFANKFGKKFTHGSLLNVALRDEMPRGFGRVVNFLQEVEPRHEPHWAFAMEK